MKVFFVKYNDPIYVKLEKLDIMIRLASQANIAQVLSELKEYATEVDVDFVRKSVRAIGRCAIKVEQSAERCVSTLLDLIQTKVNYVVQEAIVVIKDIFRKYPNKYESIIATLCENLDTLDEPEVKKFIIYLRVLFVCFLLKGKTKEIGELNRAIWHDFLGTSTASLTLVVIEISIKKLYFAYRIMQFIVKLKYFIEFCISFF